MGFFSEENIDWMERHDKSYPTPEQRIKWRIEELQLRLSELIMQETEGSGGCLPESWFSDDGLRMTDEDIRYTLPEHLHGICEVKKAIRLAEEELLVKWGVVYPLLHPCPENGTMMAA